MQSLCKVTSLRQGGRPARQNGAVLIFCLVFMLILTLMAVTGMESTILEERMAGNMRDHNMAFEAAEATLKVAEDWISAQSLLPVTSADGSTIVWTQDAPDPDTADADHWWEDSARNTNGWWDNNGIAVAGIADVASAPEYIIEEFHTSTKGQSLAIGTGGFSSTRVFHRITARGVGGSTTAVVQLQSTYVKPYD